MKHDFTFFWANNSPFSNWHKSPFIHNGLQYNCSEQYMMHMKAKLFDDSDMEQRILLEKNPRVQKELGRQVKNFDQKVWEEKCIDMMVAGLLSKFRQNPHCLTALMETGNSTIVEASPYDIVWGIGLSEDDPRAIDHTQWRGKNYLGIVLMKVRQELHE